MKKSILFAVLLPLAVTSLAGCVKYNGKNKDGSPKDSSTSAPTTSSTSGDDSGDTSSTSTLPPAPEGSVNLYLVLGPNGSYAGHAAGKVPEKYLVNTVAVTVKIGSDLPTSKEITSSISGSTFSHWVDRNTTLTVSKAPEEETVLVAVFQGGDSPTPTPSGNLPTEGFGFLFAGDDNRYALAVECTGEEEYDTEGRKQYKIANMNFVKDEIFSLFDFGKHAGWVIDLDPWSLGGKSDSDTKWTEYLQKGSSSYKVLKDFKAKDIYIKLKYEDDQLYMGLA